LLQLQPARATPGTARHCRAAPEGFIAMPAATQLAALSGPGACGSFEIAFLDRLAHGIVSVSSLDSVLKSIAPVFRAATT
jgi:hypothetical protein